MGHFAIRGRYPLEACVKLQGYSGGIKVIHAVLPVVLVSAAAIAVICCECSTRFSQDIPEGVVVGCFDITAAVNMGGNVAVPVISGVPEPPRRRNKKNSIMKASFFFCYIQLRITTVRIQRIERILAFSNGILNLVCNKIRVPKQLWVSNPNFFYFRFA